jgi:hypothetical protein
MAGVRKLSLAAHAAARAAKSDAAKDHVRSAGPDEKQKIDSNYASPSSFFLISSRIWRVAFTEAYSWLIGLEQRLKCKKSFSSVWPGYRDSR